MQLAKAYAHVHSAGRYTFMGESCYVINQMALSAIIANRNGNAPSEWSIRLVPGDTPSCEWLACADHYLHMRTRMSKNGHGLMYWRVIGNVEDTVVYDAAKLDIMELKLAPTTRPIGVALDHSLREDKSKPLSKPSILAEGSAYSGMVAGIHDYKINHMGNSKPDDNPAWFSKLYTKGKTFAI
jgi:hypothetical protein